jgi:xanthine/CO dehydrogenase XdhC/CoxF family maturation factor
MPAGLDLGSSRQEEIAVAILAQLVAWRHTRQAPAAPPERAAAQAGAPHCCHEA